MNARWTPPGEALRTMAARTGVRATRGTCSLGESLGRPLARDLRAPIDLPRADNAAVDGWALSSAHAPAQGGWMEMEAGRAAAGAPFPGRVREGHALRILTGALMPEGTDCVVMDEAVRIEGKRLFPETPPRPGANRRRMGEDIRAGDLAIAAGRVLRPQDIARAASLGARELECFSPLRVAVISSGDEITEPGEALAHARLYDSNRPLLFALLARLGVPAIDGGTVGDDPRVIRQAIDGAAGRADVIIVTGGASGGDEDHVARLLVSADPQAIWRIAMKPGRPLGMGLWPVVGSRRVPLFCLPGNPVAVFVCFLTIVRPLLLSASGAGLQEPRSLAAQAGFSMRKKPGRREYLRARLDGAGTVRLFHSTGSGLISGLQWADGLVSLEENRSTVARGDPVAYLPLAELGC